MKSTPKLSKTSKMPAKSWSLPAWETCPGARSRQLDGTVTPSPACEGCYALTGAYQFPATIASREHNLADWKNPDWVDAMVKGIGKGKLFRWFDSGDIYTMELAKKIIEVVQRTPNCKHWLPTRSHKSIQGLVDFFNLYTKPMYEANDYHPVMENPNYLPNLVVRYSSDSVTGEKIKIAENTSTIVQNAEDFVSEKGSVLCRAYTRGGKCGSCRACWSPAVKTVFYPKHGKKVSPKQFAKSLITV